VSHPVHGTKTQTAESRPEVQAKALARTLLGVADPKHAAGGET
jgi:hypothetical protein